MKLRRSSPLDQPVPPTTSRQLVRAIDDADKALRRIETVCAGYDLPPAMVAAFDNFGAAVNRLTAAVHAAYLPPKSS